MSIRVIWDFLVFRESNLSYGLNSSKFYSYMFANLFLQPLDLQLLGNLHISPEHGLCSNLTSECRHSFHLFIFACNCAASFDVCAEPGPAGAALFTNSCNSINKT